jgi:Domain of unknown function (DUF3303)
MTIDAMQGARMRFLITFTRRLGSGSEAEQARVLNLFAKWQPPLELREWCGFADGSGGMCIAETDDADLLAASTAPWIPYFDFTVRALQPIEQTAVVMSEAASFWSSIP